MHCGLTGPHHFFKLQSYLHSSGTSYCFLAISGACVNRASTCSSGNKGNYMADYIHVASGNKRSV